MSTMGWVTMIVLVVMLAQVVTYYIRMQNDRSEIDKEINEKLKELSRISELEERVQALETILTDPSESLKRDINNL